MLFDRSLRDYLPNKSCVRFNVMTETANSAPLTRGLAFPLAVRRPVGNSKLLLRPHIVDLALIYHLSVAASSLSNLVRSQFNSPRSLLIKFPS